MDKDIPNRQLSEYLTVQQAASLLGVSSSTLRNWDRSGKLKAARHPFNGYRLYLRTDLEYILKKVAQGVNKDARTFNR
jgi:excisionase family DNA binding protein